VKNRLTDLNNHLFAQLERLSDETLTGEKLAEELKRSVAVSSVADQITKGAALQLAATKFIAEHGGEIDPPAMMLAAPRQIPQVKQ
jgi:hypothetical protein